MSTYVRRATQVTALAVVAIMAPGGAAWAAAQTTPSAPSAKCAKANRRVGAEEKWVAKSQAALERTEKASASCTTKPVCDRFAIKIREEQDRKAKREARLAKLKAAAATACATP